MNLWEIILQYAVLIIFSVTNISVLTVISYVASFIKVLEEH